MEKARAVFNADHTSIDQYTVQDKRPAEAGFDLTNFGDQGFERLREQFKLGEVNLVDRTTYPNGRRIDTHCVMSNDKSVKMHMGHNPLVSENGAAGYIGIAGMSRAVVDDVVDAIMHEAAHSRQPPRISW